MGRFQQYIKGYLKVELTGYGLERFLNLCMNKELTLWEIVRKQDAYCFFISLKDFWEIKPLLKKTETKIHILKKYGLPFFFYTHRAQKCFVFGMLLCLGFVYYMSLFIWDIHVSGSAYYTEDEIISFIKHSYIGPGTKIKDINSMELEEQLMEHFDEIAWISCEIKGTQLRITLTETIVTNQVMLSDKPSDLVAAKDCDIVSVITRNGTPIARVNDSVKKGDILISGTIHIYDDNNEVLETVYIPADGDVFGRVVYNYEDSFDMQYYEKEYSGRSKRTVTLKLWNKYYQLWNPKINYTHYDVSKESYMEKLGKTFFLPFSLDVIQYKEYAPVRKEYSRQEAIDKAKKRLDAKLDKFRQLGVEILENNVKIEVGDQACVGRGTIVVKEKVGVPKNLQIVEEQTEEASEQQ